MKKTTIKFHRELAAHFRERAKECKEDGRLAGEFCSKSAASMHDELADKIAKQKLDKQCAL